MTLLQIQAELKAPKNQHNSYGNYNYRSAEDILQAVKPLLVKHKDHLYLSDEIVAIGKYCYVKATATFKEDPDHVTKVTAYAREADAQKGMSAPQLTGSASSYARKYALNGLFLIDDTKDPDTNEYHQQAQGNYQQGRQQNYQRNYQNNNYQNNNYQNYRR